MDNNHQSRTAKLEDCPSVEPSTNGSDDAPTMDYVERMLQSLNTAPNTPSPLNSETQSESNASFPLAHSMDEDTVNRVKSTLKHENSELFESAHNNITALAESEPRRTDQSNRVSQNCSPLLSSSNTNTASWSPVTNNSSSVGINPKNTTTLSSARPLLANHYSSEYTSANGITKAGYLTKQGGSWKNWKRRYFVLQNKHLFYFHNEQEAKKVNLLPLGVIPLTSFFSVIKCKPPSGAAGSLGKIFRGMSSNSGTYMFKIETVHRSWSFYADTVEDQLDWIRILEEIDIENKRDNTCSLDANCVLDSRKHEIVRGWLEQHTKGIVKRRWCVLRGDTLMLYLAPGDPSPRRTVKLSERQNTLEMVPFTEVDSDAEDEKEKSGSIFRFGIICSDGYCRWFKCTTPQDLEAWTFSLQYLIPISPNCKTIFESYVTATVSAIFGNQHAIELQDPRYLLYFDNVVASNPLLCFESEIQKQGIPLTMLPTRKLAEEAVRLAKAIKLFVNTPIDSDNVEYHLTLVQAMIQSCLANPLVQNEFLLQLTKQTSNHPDQSGSSALQVWQLYCIALSMFHPTRDVFHYIRFHLSTIMGKYHGDLLGEYAFYCLRMLLHANDGDAISTRHAREAHKIAGYNTINEIIIEGSRKYPPSYMEIMNVLNIQEPPSVMRVIIDCKNDELLSLPFDPFTKVKDVIDTLCTALNVGKNVIGSPMPASEYRLYARVPDLSSDSPFSHDKMEILDKNLYLADIIYKLDCQIRGSLKANDKRWWWLKENNAPFLVFKLRYFLPSLKSTEDRVIDIITTNATETEKRFIMNYIIQHTNFRHFKAEDLLSITAYYAQVEWGDHFPLIQNRDLVHSQIQYLLDVFHEDSSAANKIESKPGSVFSVITQSDSLVGEISNNWMCLRGKPADSCMNSFLKLTIHMVTKYSYRIYAECNGKDLADICKLDLSTTGLKIVCLGRVVVQCGYDSVSYYVKGDEKSIILGVKRAAIYEKLLPNKKDHAEAVRLNIYLADEQKHSNEFIHILRYFCDLWRK